MRDVTMAASRQRRSIWWWFWTYFVVDTFHTTLFSHVIIGIGHGREGVTATTPEWFIVRRRDVPRALLLRSRDVPAPDNKSLGCCCRNSLPTVINPLKIIPCQTNNKYRGQLLLSFTVISEVYKFFFIRNKTTFTRWCFTQQGSFGTW